MQGLTKRQQMVLDYISQSITDRGYPPTLREIGSHMGIRSTNGVNDHLRALERKGYLKREDMKSRALRPVRVGSSEGETVVSVPVVGRVAAGRPVLAEENVEDTVLVDRFFLGNQREVFGLRVRGDSMIDAGIWDGDFIFVRRQMHADKGDVVVALIGDEATVKYYHPSPEAIRLVAANSAYAPIIIRRDEFRPTQILGVVIGVYRRI
jgi:repressor LexA